MAYSYSVCFCRECLKMDLSDRNKYDNNKAYCTEYRKYFNINDKACSEHFEYDENRSSSNRSCYLTTTMCHILDFDDDCIILNVLRNFRENYMKNNKELIPILIEYDMIGPYISSSILIDPRKKQVATCLFKNYIRPIVCLIKQEKNEEAISLYKEMVNNLKILYNINYNHEEYNYNIKTLGKARI